MNHLTLLGIDLAKDKFQLCGYDQSGKVCLTSRLSRKKFAEHIAKINPCTIAMEACATSNYWARKFISFGHEVKLICPRFVKPYVKTNKNDFNDAEAICEAASRPTMRFVTPKSIEQQDIQAIHRIRTRLVQQRTSLVNQTRGLLAEYGISIIKGVNNFRKILPDILEDGDNELSHFMRECLNEIYQELIEIDNRISNTDKKLQVILKNNEASQRIQQIPGIGIITATAIIACIGENAEGFKNGRHLSAFLGLTPRQNSSGNKINLFGISKRGDSYIRSLLVSGAHSVIRISAKRDDKRSQWVNSLKERRGVSKAAVALANKNVRIVWALLAKNETYKQVA